MKQTKHQIMKQLYVKLLETSEIPIKERSDIHSKGLYLTKHNKKEIYIKASLALKAKLLVLLHEYSHYIHLTHYFNQESRAECEIIANGTAFVVCKEHGLNISRDVDLVKFTDNADVAARLTATIQAVSVHILNGLNHSTEH